MRQTTTRLFRWLFIAAVAVNLGGLALGSHVPASIAKCLLMPLLCLTGLSLMDRGLSVNMPDRSSLRGSKHPAADPRNSEETELREEPASMAEASALKEEPASMAEATEPEGPRTKKRQRAKTAYSLALAFHTLGDALLIFSGTAFFLGGMGAFFAGHIFYLLLFFSFWPRLTHGRKAAFHALLVPLMISGALAVKTLMRLEAPLALPVCLYAATLLSMLWTGLFGARVLGRTWLLVAAGAALFIVSDSLIGINSFLGISFPFRGLAVMATYIPAQVLLTIGVVRIHRSASGAWSEESGTVDSKTHDQ